jgi:hypothetical protein
MGLGSGEPWSREEYELFRAGYEEWCRENNTAVYPTETMDKTSLTQYLASWTRPAGSSVGRHAKG